MRLRMSLWRSFSMAAVAAFLILALPVAVQAGPVNGVVRDSAGQPVAGVYVQMWSQHSSGAWVPTTHFAITGSNGGYQVPNVTPGTYRVSFDDSRRGVYATGYFQGASTLQAATNLVVPIGSISGVDAALAARPVAFSGRVLDSKTSTAIPGAEVVAYRYDSGSARWMRAGATLTDPNGGYRIAGMANGSYRLGASHSSGIYGDVFNSNALSLASATTLTFNGTQLASLDLRLQRETVSRVSGSSRYTTAVEMVYEQYARDGGVDFDGVRTLILASGDDRAAADPLSATGLCYSFQVTKAGSPNLGKGAPLVLVPGSGTVPGEVRRLAVDIARGDSRIGVRGNGANAVRLVVVGGPASVPDAQVAAIARAAENAGATVTTQRVAGPDRYATARAVAAVMQTEAGRSTTDSIHPPRFALVANGAEPAKFFDALSLSPVAARNGAPVLLTAADHVPAPTRGAVTQLGLKGSDLWIAGGPASVSAQVASTLGVPSAQRMAGQNRYSTAVAVANRSVANGWLSAAGGRAKGAGAAARPTDALTGGALCGDRSFGYPIVLLDRVTVPSETRTWLRAERTGLDQVFVLGGEQSVSLSAEDLVRSTLQ